MDCIVRFCGRDPDSLGLEACRNLLLECGDPTMILAGIMGSDEYRVLHGLQKPAEPSEMVQNNYENSVEAISDLAMLTERLDAMIKIRKYDIDRATVMASRFYFDPPKQMRAALMEHPPGSRESYDAQMRLIFEPIAGHKHRIDMEGHDSSFMTVASAFPFCLAPKDVGYWTMAYGFFLNCLSLPAGALVLEIGFGAGGLTELLVRGGLNVTAVELRESNCETLRSRVNAFAGSVNAIKVDSTDSFEYPGTYDAIIFYEAFHHMPAPLELLKHLKKFLNPQGFFAFGAEPIQPASPNIPFPWGFRMDGGSLGAIREAGWVEFGFQEEFFREILDQVGFTVTRMNIPGNAHCDVWVTKPKASLPS